MKNFGNYAVDSCLAACVNSMDSIDYDAMLIKYVPRIGRIYIDWMGYSFSCYYGRCVASVETIGM